MRLSQKIWLTVLFCTALSLYVVGCVDVDNGAVSTVDLRSTVRFVNMINTANPLSVQVDGSTPASINFGEASAYGNYPAGTRAFVFNYVTKTDSFQKALPHDMKCSYYSVLDPALGDSVATNVLLMERQTFTGSVTYIPGSILVRFINFSKDTISSLSKGAKFKLFTSATEDSTKVLKFSNSSPYFEVPNTSDPHFLVLGAIGDSAVTLIDTTALSISDGRFSILLYGSGTLQTKIFQED